MNYTSNDQRVRIIITGIVQGVGFRPFVYRLATKYCFSGFVRNSNGRVEIEVQGKEGAISDFLDELRSDAPPLSKIEELRSEIVEVLSKGAFSIESSNTDSPSKKFLPPDAATCEECLIELFDQGNRRYRYPFINCTNCGPRFTIIESLPYDRASTSMCSFQMCMFCQSEYDDPSSRRFHAEPIACSSCGPKLRWRKDGSGNDLVFEEDALRKALEALANEEIIAVKGLGGFHLIADASSYLAVERLRSKKKRTRKPFALMMSDIDMVGQHCKISHTEEKILTDTSRPIVLLSKRPDSDLPINIAPGNNRLGVMLAYTPLHHLLLREFNKPIIASSANISEEPIAIDNEEALLRLGRVADGFLDHDRDIRSRYDDSVLQVIGGSRQIMRRSRGFAPKIIELPFNSQKSILACGAHLKNTFCLIKDATAYVSQHIGDLENLETSEHFMHSLKNYLKLFDLDYEIIVHDMHPDYASSAIAEKLGAESACPVLTAQHHHAHIVSCMVDNMISSREVIGVAFDGIGYGEDDSLWGGEFLIATYSDFERFASFEPVAMPGGTLAIKQPWRMALSYLSNGSRYDGSIYELYLQSLKEQLGEETIKLILQQIRQKINAPMSSSCGRLFDAVASILGICQIAEYEAQAAIELETVASNWPIDELFAQAAECRLKLNKTGKVARIELSPLLQAVFADLESGLSKEQVAARFHYRLATIVLEVCKLMRESNKLNDVCLGGGVFQNKLLLSLSKELLSKNGFNVFSAVQVPPNDGGLSLGQAAITLAKLQAITFKGAEVCV